MLGLAVVLAAAAVVYQTASDADQHRRADAARALASASASPADSPSAPQDATASQPPAASPTSSSAVTQPRAGVVVPPASFSWPAAGFSVNVVPTDWDPAVPVNPSLDANGFDSVGHWLKGSGESLNIQPVVITAHTCYDTASPLCNPTTFPFNRLSTDNWAVGQPASITDAHGAVIPCTLAERKLVDKSKQFTFRNDPCLVVLFTCNLDRPEDLVTLVTFRCGQCA